jgi:hypothetical protein
MNPAMASTRGDTTQGNSPKGKTPREEGGYPLILVILLVASVIISAAFLLRDSGVVPGHPMDQSFAAAADLSIRRSEGHWIFQYPSLQSSGGITSSLIAGLYKLIIPTSEVTLNWHIRILAMVMYLGSSWWLVRSLIASAPGRVLAYLVICISGFQFLQPSSDLFAGSFFNLALIGLRRGWPTSLTALLLAIFGLTKVEMIAAAVVIAVLWGIREHHLGRRNPARLTWLTCGWLLLFLAPGLLIQGANPAGGDRSLLAFITAYTDFLSQHQFASFQGTIDMDSVKAAKFPEAKSLLDIITKYPQLYFDFVGLSTARSLPNLVHGGKLMLIPLGLVIFQNHRLCTLRPYLIILLAAIAFTLIPAWLIIFVKIRYVAKLFPAIVAVAVGGCIELSSTNKRANQILWACGIGTLLWEAYFLQDMWQYSHFK